VQHSDIQFNDDRFYSILPVLDDDDDNNPNTSLLPSLPKWAMATLTNATNFISQPSQ
jgi:hypothetical protein